MNILHGRLRTKPRKEENGGYGFEIGGRWGVGVGVGMDDGGAVVLGRLAVEGGGNNDWTERRNEGKLSNSFRVQLTRQGK
ncbi:hypothetical protein SESBI_15279 [Sesbania bispinosa]|nr:hypothetical protein SESBI_15279 [Sesbania bispinosa]